MDWSAIGKRIRCQREYMGLTREQFAEQIEVTPKFCSDIETGAKGMSVPPSAASPGPSACPPTIFSMADGARRTRSR